MCCPALGVHSHTHLTRGLLHFLAGGFCLFISTNSSRAVFYCSTAAIHPYYEISRILSVSAEYNKRGVRDFRAESPRPCVKKGGDTGCTCCSRRQTRSCASCTFALSEWTWSCGQVPTGNRALNAYSWSMKRRGVRDFRAESPRPCVKRGENTGCTC